MLRSMFTGAWYCGHLKGSGASFTKLSYGKD